MIRPPRRQWAFLLCLVAAWTDGGCAAAPAPLPVAQEGSDAASATGPARPNYDLAWAIRPGGTVPDWARPGRIRFARWDGGPLETAKGVLSGWPNFDPPVPDVLRVMTDWYDLRTIALLKQAGINLIWVTFSNGFANPTEAGSQKLLRPYIAECHRQGIRVMAYESVANMFWEDMFRHVPESRDWVKRGRDGKPVPYSGANYSRFTRIPRYMADLDKAGWRDYLKRRIDLALAAGVDGIMYDNCPNDHLAEALKELAGYAYARRPDLLFMANLHDPSFVLNHLLNCITMEEEREPGVWRDVSVLTGAKSRWIRDLSGMLRPGGGYLVSNIGLLRLFDALGEGGRPVMVEANFREAGDREDQVMAPDRQKRAMAEAMIFNFSHEASVENRMACELWKGTPRAKASWDAVGLYNRFFSQQEDCYSGFRPEATLGVVLDDRSEGVAILNGLSERNLQYHVLYERSLSSEILTRYSAIALLTAETVHDRSLACLRQYVSRGGKLLVLGSSGLRDGEGRPRPRPSWFNPRLDVPDVGRLAALLRSADAVPPVEVSAPPGVLYAVTRDLTSGRRVIHLLNYLSTPAGECRIKVHGKWRRVRILSPDASVYARHEVQQGNAETDIRLRQLFLYTLILLEP